MYFNLFWSFSQTEQLKEISKKHAEWEKVTEKEVTTKNQLILLLGQTSGLIPFEFVPRKRDIENDRTILKEGKYKVILFSFLDFIITNQKNDGRKKNNQKANSNGYWRNIKVRSICKCLEALRSFLMKFVGDN